MRSMLDIENGEEIKMREILFAPGWKAPHHYHNSDLFIYAIAGNLERYIACMHAGVSLPVVGFHGRVTGSHE